MPNNLINYIPFPKTNHYENAVNVVLNNIHKGIVYTNSRNEILYINNKFTEITGYTFEEVKGKTPKFMQSGIQGENFYDEMKSDIDKFGKWKGKLWNRTKYGDIYLQELEVFAFKDEEGKIENFIGFLSKLSGHEMLEYTDKQDADYYDPLTTLPNRILFEKRLHSTLQLLGNKAKNVTVIFFQVQNYHEINEKFGLLFGNILLKRVAKRMEKQIPINSMVSRWNGTTFACVLEGYRNRSDIEKIIVQYIKVLTSPFVINGISIELSVRFGINMYNSEQGDISVSTLLKNAKRALVQAKKREQLYCFYDNTMGFHGHFIVMESEIVRAINEKEFILYYQPLLNAETSELKGFEALIRWNHPTEGLISPGNFIPLAEKTGLINDIGEFVFKEACEQQVRWRKAGFGDLLVSINLSMNQFKDDFLVEFVSRTLKETGANPNYISIELTESSFSDDVEDTILKLKQLRSLGISIAIDDFGTGYSSLGYLIDFPINTIKIDRSFIKVIEQNEKIEAIVKAINSMAKALNIEVVAEGIETKTQYNLVKQLQCNIVQGFLFDRPQQPEIVEKKWLAP